MTTDILIKTYRGDYSWLPFCLLSIRNNLRGWGECHVIYDKGDPAPEVPHWVRLSSQTMYPDKAGIPRANRGTASFGYHHQKVVKMEWVKLENITADSVLILDSDSMVTERVDLRKLYFDPITGRPRWFVIPWDEASDRHKAAWGPGRERLLSGCTLDHMRGVGFLLEREATRGFNLYLQARFGSVADAFLGKPPFFSEYQAFGQWLERIPRDTAGYQFTPEIKPWPIKTFHSWTGFTYSKVEEMVRSLS